MNAFRLSATEVLGILREWLVLEDDHVLGAGMTNVAFMKRHN